MISASRQPDGSQNATEQISKHSTELQEQIRRQAYELYEQRGRQEGFDLDDWLRAESELTQKKTKAARA